MLQFLYISDNVFKKYIKTTSSPGDEVDIKRQVEMKNKLALWMQSLQFLSVCVRFIIIIIIIIINMKKFYWKQLLLLLLNTAYKSELSACMFSHDAYDNDH